MHDFFSSCRQGAISLASGLLFISFLHVFYIVVCRLRSSSMSPQYKCSQRKMLTRLTLPCWRQRASNDVCCLPSRSKPSMLLNWIGATPSRNRFAWNDVAQYMKHVRIVIGACVDCRFRLHNVHDHHVANVWTDYKNGRLTPGLSSDATYNISHAMSQVTCCWCCM